MGRSGVWLAVLVSLAGGCAPAGDDTAPAKVENAALGIALASVPAPFVVETNEGGRLVLSAGEGTVEFGAGPEDPGLNLVEERKLREAAFKDLPEGELNGSRELGTPFGPAYYTRGSYRAEDGSRVEETWILAWHPAGDRLLTLAYRYPPGEGQERVNQLLVLLGEVEALDGPEPAA